VNNIEAQIDKKAKAIASKKAQERRLEYQRSEVSRMFASYTIQVVMSVSTDGIQDAKPMSFEDIFDVFNEKRQENEAKTFAEELAKAIVSNVSLEGQG